MEFNILFYLALMLFSGLFFGRLVKYAKLPNVTGYLIAGLIIGPYGLKLIPLDKVIGFEVVSEMALAFIAFSVGAEFKISYIKKVGIASVVIAIFEAVIAAVAVMVTLVLLGFSLQIALLLGAIACATAPAATVMVVRQYRAKGPLTETLLSVVALDDAVALITFGIVSAIVRTMQYPGEISLVMSVLSPLVEIFGSFLLGFALGMLFTIPLRFFKKDSNRVILATGFTFLGSALASMLGLSPLLLCMCMGAVFVNMSDAGPSILKLVDGITPPIFLMFFVVSGMELDTSILPQTGVIGIAYIISRVIGKIAGAYIGAVLVKASDTVKKYLGYTLVPQAGVAIGLSLLASRLFPECAQTIRAVVLSATFIYELVGPAITKVVLQKAGEISD
jgi:Kef-type K+ transport system membrane component KefB